MAEKSQRDALRSKLLGNAPKAETKIVKLFGQDVELRQPTLASILEAQDTEDIKKRSVDMIVRYAYVPGTNERIFEDSDAAVILEWPFNRDLVSMQKAIGDLTGVDISETEVKIKKDPLEGQ